MGDLISAGRLAQTAKRFSAYPGSGETPIVRPMATNSHN
jgi:hypothetical protein